jgi:hypothetical protein
LFTEEDLIAEVISKNIPAAWMKDFKMFKLHLMTKIKDIISELTVIEEQVKTHPKSNQEHSHKKQLKNPCQLYNGNHEWDDCRQNPKNQKNDEKATMITTATGIMGTITEIEKKTDAPNQTALNL